MEELCKAFGQAKHQPTAIIAKTFKGKGISGNQTIIALHTHVDMPSVKVPAHLSNSMQKAFHPLYLSATFTAEKIGLVSSSEACASCGVFYPWDTANAHSVCQGLP